MKYTMMGLLHFYDWTRKGTEADVRRRMACRKFLSYLVPD